jgi:hypothetical protein
MTDNNGSVLAPLPVAPSHETDMVLLPKGLNALQQVAKEVGLDLRGAYVNLDGGFDSRANRTCIFHAGMIPDITENPRNRKHTKRGRKRFFNAASQPTSRTMRHTPRAWLISGQHRPLVQGQISPKASPCHHPDNLVVFPQHCPQARCQGGHGRTAAGAGFWGLLCSGPVRHATLHADEMGTPSSHASRASALRPADCCWSRGVVSGSRHVREVFPVEGVEET